MHLLLGGQFGLTESGPVRPLEVLAAKVVAHARCLTGGNPIHTRRRHHVPDLRVLNLLRHAASVLLQFNR